MNDLKYLWLLHFLAVLSFQLKSIENQLVSINGTFLYCQLSLQFVILSPFI